MDSGLSRNHGAFTTKPGSRGRLEMQWCGSDDPAGFGRSVLSQHRSVAPGHGKGTKGIKGMQSNVIKAGDDRRRLILLGITLVVVVLLPSYLLRNLSETTQQALALVGHTKDVRSEVSQLLADARDVEAATLAIANGFDSPAMRARFAQSSADVRPTLDRLTELTLDIPIQQVRIGGLQAHLEQRIAMANDIVRDDGDSAEQTRRDLADMISHYPIKDIAQAIIATEETLLRERTATAEREQTMLQSVRIAAGLAQLLALSLIALFWLRQLRAREAAEHGRQQANTRAQSVLQSVREPIVLLDAGQNVLMHNAAFSELYAIGDEDIQGKPLAEIGGGAWDDGAVLQRLRDVLLRNRELWDYEQVQHPVDAGERTMLINALRMPLPDTDERVVLMTISDITARKATQDEIVDLNRQLEGKVDQVSEINRELEAFSYSVSHDLRAPLRHISGFADKLARHLGDAADAKSQHYISVMGDSAKRMSTLIDDLLVYSRLGRSALRLQQVDMQSLVGDVRSMLASNLNQDAPGHLIEWRIAPLPILIADENMMRQVWLNLLGNAVKYSARSDPAVIEVSHKRLEDGVHEFTVSDNGAGFDMQYADKLFGVFQRLHRVSDYPGTGIGLATVRRILLRHGGKISAEAAPDAGASFRFTLPANLDSASIARPDRSTSSGTQPA